MENNNEDGTIHKNTFKKGHSDSWDAFSVYNAYNWHVAR